MTAISSSPGLLFISPVFILEAHVLDEVYDSRTPPVFLWTSESHETFKNSSSSCFSSKHKWLCTVIQCETVGNKSLSLYSTVFPHCFFLPWCIACSVFSLSSQFSVLSFLLSVIWFFSDLVSSGSGSRAPLTWRLSLALFRLARGQRSEPPRVSASLQVDVLRQGQRGTLETAPRWAGGCVWSTEHADDEVGRTRLLLCVRMNKSCFFCFSPIKLIIYSCRSKSCPSVEHTRWRFAEDIKSAAGLERHEGK